MKTKITIIGITLIALSVAGVWELYERRLFDTMVAERDTDFEKNKPFYECIIAASAMVGENPSAEEVMAAGVAESECYDRYQ